MTIKNLSVLFLEKCYEIRTCKEPSLLMQYLHTKHPNYNKKTYIFFLKESKRPNIISFFLSLNKDNENAVGASYKLLCGDKNSLHVTFLFHTEMRWLSKRKLHTRLFELRNKVQVFF